MAPEPALRLPATRTQTQKIPSGVEGGKEFARIMNLLLSQEACGEGRNLTIFDDAAGDFLGLDSFEETPDDRTIGYQYKFFDSPLNPSQRGTIEDSLKIALSQHTVSKLKKWILVLPEDLTEAARKKGGGDVSWFQGLKAKYKVPFEMELWGHIRLQNLFLQHRSLCLRYFPELVPDGPERKQSIEEIRRRYDKGLAALYGNIQFIGMSVRDEEANHSVPMEQIYIPLKVQPEGDSGSRQFWKSMGKAGRAPITQRPGRGQRVIHNEMEPVELVIERERKKLNALELLTNRQHSVVLGDPGSGKSTLLKFLALAGITPALQERYKLPPDARLPIIVPLKQYANALQTRKNDQLALIDFIQEYIRVEFSLSNVDQAFLEYYLDSGQALLALMESDDPAYREIFEACYWVEPKKKRGGGRKRST